MLTAPIRTSALPNFGSPNRRPSANSPMNTNATFLEFWDQFCQGQATAQGEFYEKFASQLAWLARQKLSERVRQRVETDDFVQTVLGTFIRKQKDGGFQPVSWNSLWKYLEAIALYKCQEKQRFHRRQSRDIGREVELPNAESESSNELWQAVSREPRPDEVSVVIDLVEQLHRAFSEEHWPILKLLLDGSFTQAEISDQTGFSERTIRRVLKQVEETLQSLVSSACDKSNGAADC